MNYQRGLVQTLCEAGRTWGFYRSEGRKLRRWLKGGRVTLSAEVDAAGAGVLAGIIMKAIACGADEVLIARRRLTGLRDVDTHPEFWKPEYAGVFKAGVESARAPATAESWEATNEHFARYHGFWRFDEYHGVGGEVGLVGGYEIGLFEGLISVFKEQFSRDWRLLIETAGGWPDPVRGRECVVSRAEEVCGARVEPAGIGLTVRYERGGG